MTMAVASLMLVAKGIVMAIPPSQPNRRRRPVLVKLEKFSLPVASAGLFSGGFMSANELALKYSSAPAESLIGVLPVMEVKEALRDEVEDDVYGELSVEHRFEIEALEDQNDEANRLALKFELVAESFGTAIKLALTLPHGEAIQVLRDVIEDNPGYGREPVKG